MSTRAQTYDPAARAFHWLVFALLAAQYTVGFLMPHIGRNTPNEGLVSWHLSVGAAILFFILLRLVWRLTHPVATAEGLTGWETGLSHLTHWALYLLVLAMTVLGWAAANYRGWDVKLFGVVTLPPLAPKGTAWAHQAGDIHNRLVYVLLAFIALHVAGALFHYFVRRDTVMERMLPMARQKG